MHGYEVGDNISLRYQYANTCPLLARSSKYSCFLYSRYKKGEKFNFMKNRINGVDYYT